MHRYCGALLAAVLILSFSGPADAQRYMSFGYGAPRYRESPEVNLYLSARYDCVSAGGKIPHEAAGQSGCAGVKNRQQIAFVGQWQGPGDEGRGALCSGSLCGSD